jgi:HSP20 family molecular chaperone IbpA
LAEDKKKMYYYYGGKEKKAGEIKKRSEGLAPYDRDFDLMMERFQREFDDFLSMPPMWKRWMHVRPGFPMMPFRHMMMPSVDVEDRGKDYRVTTDLPGFSKEDVNIEVSEDSVMIHAKKNMAEEEKQKNMCAKNEWLKRFIEGLICQRKLSQIIQKRA